MTPPSRSKTRNRGSAAIVAVLGAFSLALALALSSLTLGTASHAHAAQARRSSEAYYVALAALNEAVEEVRTGVDGTGNRAAGLGALGLPTPVPYRDSTGRRVGEYRTWVANTALADQPALYVVRALAALPNFAHPEVTHAMQCDLTSKEVFLLTPNVGAVSISGPLNGPVLYGWNSADLLIDGDTVPGLVFSDESAHLAAIDALGAEFAAGNLDGSEVLGTPTTSYESASGPLTLSLVSQTAPAFSSTQLNSYRNALRVYAERLVHATPVGDSVTVDYAAATADGVIVVHELDSVKDGAGSGKPRIVSNHALGTPESPETVLIDTSMFCQGGAVTTDNSGRTITGAGTLVIMHPIGSATDNANGKQFDLEWTGDVFVVGYPADHTTGVGENSASDNMLFISRADWAITGNLVIATAGDTEASLELRGLGSDPANLVVNGSVLVFGDATTKEAEIDVEGYAHFEVNGIVGGFGARVEIENQSSTTTDFIVNGTLALGLPDENPRADDFLWDARGNVKVTYDRANVEAAAAGLVALQASLDLSSTNVSTIQVSSSATLTQGNDFSALSSELADLIATGGNDGLGEFGVELDALGGD